MKPKRNSGILRKTSNVAYAFDLPKLSNPETEEYLQKLCGAYLTFLEKESEKPCDHLRFGGLRPEKEGKKLVLFAAFCPFEMREYRTVATIFLDDNEKILRIQKEKRSRRKRS